MARTIESDRVVTVGTARAALSAASEEGWSRLNPAFTRAQILSIFRDAIKGRGDDEILDRLGLTSKNIRREVGVDGSLPGLAKPLQRRQRSHAKEWPT